MTGAVVSAKRRGITDPDYGNREMLDENGRAALEAGRDGFLSGGERGAGWTDAAHLDECGGSGAWADRNELGDALAEETVAVRGDGEVFLGGAAIMTAQLLMAVTARELIHMPHLHERNRAELRKDEEERDDLVSVQMHDAENIGSGDVEVNRIRKPVGS
jgi:hypothetical protein